MAYVTYGYLCEAKDSADTRIVMQLLFTLFIFGTMNDGKPHQY